MSEIAPAGGGPNRMFILLALGLAGLLVLGVIGLGGYFVIQNLIRPPAAPTRIALATATRPASTPTVASTATPADIATPTLVNAPAPATATVIGGSDTSSGGATPAPGSGDGQLPKSGMGEDLLLLSGGFVLILIIVAARRARSTGTS